MRYKEFGKTGMKVSEMSLGTWGIGGAGWDANAEETRIDAIKAAVENGINFIDTAPAYNGGIAEQIIGKALTEMGARKDVIISTKCGTDFIDGKYVRDCGYDNVIRECNESLKNLNTDYIDVYLIHWPDANVTIEETMKALVELKKQGKILHIGVSNYSIEQIEEAEKYAKIEVYQPQYSMVFRDKVDQMKWAAEKGIGVMTYGSLGAGILTGKMREFKTYEENDNRNRFYKHFQEPMFSKVQQLLKVMDQLSEEKGGVPLSQIALNWTCQKDFVHSSIVGSQHRSKIAENCAGFDWTLTADEMKKLDDAIELYLG